MNTFEREQRYIVIKLKDLRVTDLTKEELNTLETVCNKIARQRLIEGKPEFNCVVVEDTWPEYEQVWKMLEGRVNEPIAT
jgi:hypothetical protein